MPSRSTTGAGRSRLLAATAAALLIAAFFAASAQAETITVTNTEDGVGKCPSASECTLRKAVEVAKESDTISLGSGIFKLAGKPLEIRKNITIAGTGATTITTSSPSELIYLYEAELTISGVTLKGGTALAKTEEITEGAKKILAEGFAPGKGGAIYNDYGILRVNGCTFTENTAKAAYYAKSANEGEGGAIYNYGKTTIVNSTFTDNTAEGAAKDAEYDRGGEGGAVYNYYGTLSISSSTFTANNVTGGGDTASKGNDGAEGAAVYSYYGRTTIAGSTFSGNIAHGGAATEGGLSGGYEGYGGALYLEESATTISNSTITENTAGSGADGTSKYGYGGYGGGIYNDAGSLTLTGSVVKENTAASTHYGGEGGGVYSYGSLTVQQSTIVSNKAPHGYGGGLVGDGGHLSVIQSTVSGNEAENAGGIYGDGSTSVSLSTVSSNNASGGYGGGIYNEEPELELTQSTVSGNTAKYGGGIYNDAPLGADNSTIAGNTATEEGGGIYNESIGSLANVTLYGNVVEAASGGGNLYLDEYPLTLHDTLIAAGSAPTSDGNCAFNGGVIVSRGYNAEDANQCMLNPLLGDQVGAVLDLGPLGNYGGPTQTVALLAGSAAIDKGDPAGCTGVEGELLTTDQRGVARPQNGRCDVGAFEFVPPPAGKPESKPTPTPTAPKDSSLTIKPSSFAPTSGSASIAKRHKGKKQPKGATVSYTDSQAATTTFTIVSLQHGYRVGKGLCKVASKHGKAPKHGKPCTHEATMTGSFAHLDNAGHNQFVFSGHLDGRKLAKGSYVLIARPKLGSLVGPTVSVAFKIT